MINRYRTFLGAVALCALALSSAYARDYSDIPPALARFNPGIAREQYLASVLTELRQLDRQGDGLDAADIDEADAFATAAQRAAALMRVFAFDLNNDGRVERGEIEHVFAARARVSVVGGDTMDRLRDQQIAEIMKADQNGDGAIDFTEARSRPVENFGIGDYRTKKARELLALDPNKNGRLTAQELETLARKAFAVVDENGDGVLSRDEFDAYRKIAMPARSYPGLPGMQACDVPKAADNERVVVVGSYQGDALSTVAVAGQDEATTASRVEIESGSGALYVVLGSYSSRVWQFSGSVNRVAHVVLIGTQPSGVTGVARDKVTFLPPGNCRLFQSKPDEVATAMARGQFVHALGRAPDVIVGNFNIATVQLPSGTMVKEPPPNKPSGLTPGADSVWADLVRLNPAGIAQVEVSAVVAKDSAVHYDVMPKEAGLMQLLNEGALTVVSASKYKIVKPLKRFPADLAGPHGVTFLLGKGIAMPPGNPGTSCVISEETGMAIGMAAFCINR